MAQQYRTTVPSWIISPPGVFTAGVDKIQPVGQVRPAKKFCRALGGSIGPPWPRLVGAAGDVALAAGCAAPRCTGQGQHSS